MQLIDTMDKLIDENPRYSIEHAKDRNRNALSNLLLQRLVLDSKSHSVLVWSKREKFNSLHAFFINRYKSKEGLNSIRLT